MGRQVEVLLVVLVAVQCSIFRFEFLSVILHIPCVIACMSL